MTKNKLKSKIESVLFVFGDPISVKKLAKILKAKEGDVKDALSDLLEDYKDRGINILVKDDKVQMVTSAENSNIIESIVQSSLSDELTPAALETLAIIAYKEPISRFQIDEIRGVNSVFSLKTLLMRGLIEKKQSGDDKKDVYYKTTLDFLKKLGVSKVSDLPEYEKLSKVFEKNSNDGE